MSLIHAIIGNHMPNMAYGMPFMALKKQIMLHFEKYQIFVLL